MTQDTENLILGWMRKLDAKLDAIFVDLKDIKLRQGDAATAIAALRRDQAGDAGVAAHLQIQIDRLSDKVERIIRRLDIVDA